MLEKKGGIAFVSYFMWMYGVYVGVAWMWRFSLFMFGLFYTKKEMKLLKIF